MGARAPEKILEELRKQGITVYSISRLDTINQCLLGAYKTYIQHDRGQGNVYSYCGGRVHEVLEDIMNDKATEADLLPAVQKELEDMDIAGIHFPKDRNGDDSIRNGWIADMEHFCRTYKRPKGEFETEKFVVYKSPDGHYIQGYIDLLRHNSDGSVTVYDYKTSSMYRGDSIRDHGRQLLTYALALEQEGYTVSGVAWIMLKYCDVTFEGFKMSTSTTRSTMTKTIERRKIGFELAKYVRTDLKACGYDEIDIAMVTEKFARSNDLNDLPEEIRDHYKIRTCVMVYDYDDYDVDECNDYIDETINRWEALSGEVDDYPPTYLEYNAKGEPSVSFFCRQLCNHKDCEAVRKYLEEQSATKSDSLFD